VDIAAKLQIKPGMRVAILGTGPNGPDLSGLPPHADDPADAGAVIAVVVRAADLASTAGPAIEAARDDRVAWIAYPKGGKLGTDLNRDSLARAAADLGIQPVRQVALDEVWSALRFRPAS
jgi:hypothetical protein